MSKRKAVFAFALLLVGFLIIAGPYMKLKGAVFPKKQLVEFATNIQSSEVYERGIQIYSNGVCAASFAPSDIAGALGKLVQRVSETLMWFFVPALLIGMYKHLGRRNWCEPERFFTIALIVLNVSVMILLYCKFGYMSRRHTLPLVVFTIFYVPAGLEALAFWLDKKLSKTMDRLFAITMERLLAIKVKANTNFWFSVLLVIGISICSLKLLMPKRIEKQSYRDAAQWLAKNTDESDIIATSDVRISFYAEREGIRCEDGPIPGKAGYFVKVVKDSSQLQLPRINEKLEVKKIFEGPKKKSEVIIYRIH